MDRNCALLVIDIQQEDFAAMNEENLDDPAWTCIRNAKRVLDVFRLKAAGHPIKEVHRPDMVDFGRALDGAEGIHCLKNASGTDYAWLTYPIQGNTASPSAGTAPFSVRTWDSC